MSLDEYRKKRNFAETPEPSGRSGGRRRGRAGATRLFVVQKHAARRLHYDFRLEIDGVLVSWAVPRGPSMNPADKRLAIRTEDHPLEYAEFEGVIPEGQYGAGTVMVWDKGVYEPPKGVPPREQLAGGKIDAVLRGRKLRGGFTLIRIRKPRARSGGTEQWLLVKQRDEHADTSWDVERPELDRSVASGRTLAQIAGVGARSSR